MRRGWVDLLYMIWGILHFHEKYWGRCTPWICSYRRISSHSNMKDEKLNARKIIFNEMATATSVRYADKQIKT